MDEERLSQAQPERSGDAEQVIELDLRLYVEQGSALRRGRTRDGSGREHSFHGWLGLLGVLERLCSPEAPPRNPESQPTPGGKR